MGHEWRSRSRRIGASALAVVTLSALLVTASGSTAWAAAGDPDSSFGTGGFVTSDFGSSEDANAVAIQADGKIVVAGDYAVAGEYQCAVARYLTNGDLDPSFDGDGIAVTTTADPGCLSNAVAIQPDGMIVTAGYGETGDQLGHASVIRYQDNGVPDPGFGDNGVVLTPVGMYGRARAIALQPDGAIVIAGPGHDPSQPVNGSSHIHFFVYRYLSGGTLDPGFSGDGELYTTEGGFGSQASSVVVQSTGRVVVGGLSQADEGPPKLELLGLQSDGTPDPAFGDNGVVLTTAPGTPYINALALTSDDHIVAVGTAGAPNIPAFLAARYSADGVIDPTFGTGGLAIASAPPSSNSQLSSVALQPDGKILAGGFVETIPDVGAVVVRFRTNGALDASFGGGTGMTAVAGPGNNQGWGGLALQSDGYVVAAGGGHNDLNLARYQAWQQIAPAAPTGVVAAAGDGEASVSWAAPTEGGSPVTGYTVTSAPGAISVAVPGNTTTATITGLTNDVAYTFTVTATNAIGTGPASSPSNGTTPHAGTALPFTISESVDGLSPSVSTDPDSSGPTPAEPVTAGVTAPANVESGTIALTTTAITEPEPSGFSFVGLQVDISAAVTPAPTAAAPLSIVFGIDASMISGLAAESVQIYRAEGGAPVAVPDCAGAAGVADPDPCVASRVTDANGNGTITVLTSSASTWNAAISNTAPHITHVSKAAGTVAQLIKITGTGLANATAIHFGGADQPTFQVKSDTLIKVRVPAAAVTGVITVTTPSGTAASTPFGIVPKVTSFTPASAPIGAHVTITGTGFAGVTSVKFAKAVAIFTIDSPTQLTATVPAHARTAKITVTTAGGKAKSNTKFTLL